MSIAEIQRIDISLTWKTIFSFASHEQAIRHLNEIAKRHAWRFVEDQTVFGGYYVDDITSDCYRVK